MRAFRMVHNLSSNAALVKAPAASPHMSEAGTGRRLERRDTWKEKAWDQADLALTAHSQGGLSQLSFWSIK